ncbi:MAG: tRNA lysidine(34) synthetase TilS, partial [Bacteroidota bacterium]
MLFKKFIHFIDFQKLFAPDKPVLLALSGGLDSTMMAHLFFKAGFSFAIAHCNFGLRGIDSDEDARFAANLSGNFGVDFYSEKFNTKEYAGKNGISIQMAARELRYKWFEEIRSKHGYHYIATAHHLDDQAETFLINLIRGTGIAGFHGIPVKNEKVIRPMMFARRNEIALYAKKHSIAFRDDLSNNEIKYLRNKIRHEIL